MSALSRLGACLAHADPLTASCNRIALLVAFNQPIYPLYVWWMVGGGWQVACWTFVSTPFFVAVPALARRNAVAGRALLPLAGIANGIIATKAFGEASGVELFLVPCGLIAWLGFRRAERRASAALLLATIIALLPHGHYGQPLGQFTAADDAHFIRLNGASVVLLSACIAWSLGRARAASAPR